MRLKGIKSKLAEQSLRAALHKKSRPPFNGESGGFGVGREKSEPGAVATGSHTQFKISRSLWVPIGTYAQSITRSLPLPVLIFLGPRGPFCAKPLRVAFENFVRASDARIR